jgi:hypothetical protein
MTHDAIAPNEFELAVVANLADVSHPNGTSVKHNPGLKRTDANLVATMCSLGSKDGSLGSEDGKAPASCKEGAMEQFLATYWADSPTPYRTDSPVPARMEVNAAREQADAPISTDCKVEVKVANKVAKLPLTTPNIVALSVLTVFAIIGAVYVWILGTRKSCGCKLCRGDYRIEKMLGKVPPVRPSMLPSGNTRSPQLLCMVLCIASMFIICHWQGGFGEVFLVTRAADQKQLVLKKCIVGSVAEANQAQDEAKELRRLKHPYDSPLFADFRPTPSARRNAQPL